MTPKFALALIKARCRVDEDTGCQLWTGTVSQSGAPVATHKNEHGKRPTVQIRRQVWEQRHGPIPEGMYVTYTCQHPRCLQHLKLATRGEVVSRNWARADARANMTRASTEASRKRAKASMEVARSIRASNDTLEVEAARHGISIALASLIRRGLRWKEPGNPWAALMASNDSARRAAA